MPKAIKILGGKGDGEEDLSGRIHSRWFPGLWHSYYHSAPTWCFHCRDHLRALGPYGLFLAHHPVSCLQFSDCIHCPLLSHWPQGSVLPPRKILQFCSRASEMMRRPHGLTHSPVSAAPLTDLPLWVHQALPNLTRAPPAFLDLPSTHQFKL